MGRIWPVQWAVNSRQGWAMDTRKWKVGKTVSSGQWAAGCKEWEVDSEQWVVSSGQSSFENVQ